MLFPMCMVGSLPLDAVPQDKPVPAWALHRPQFLQGISCSDLGPSMSSTTFPPQAVAWLSAPMWALHRLQGAWSTSCFFDVTVCKAFPSLCVQLFVRYYIPRSTTSFTEGLNCAHWWLPWNCLEPAGTAWNCLEPLEPPGTVWNQPEPVWTGWNQLESAVSGMG